MLEIDGSYGEGGGAILRLATGLSICTKTPIHVFNIRKNRPKSGLATQHLVGLKAAAELCSGKLEGAEIGSTEITFIPGNAWKEKLKVEIGTAGSVGLVLQVLQIASVFAPHKVKVEIKGGASYGKWAPPLDYLKNVTFKFLEKLGYSINLEIKKEGFYPKGGAVANVSFNPVEELKPINLVEFGEAESISGISIASEHLNGARVAERQKIAARDVIFNELEISPKIEEKYVTSLCPGSGIALWAKTSTGALIGADAIGERSIRAEEIGKSVASGLVSEISAKNVVDSHLLDQIIPFLALTKGTSNLKVSHLTPHAETNIWLCKQFLDRSISFSNGILRFL